MEVVEVTAACCLLPSECVDSQDQECYRMVHESITRGTGARRQCRPSFLILSPLSFVFSVLEYSDMSSITLDGRCLVCFNWPKSCPCILYTSSLIEESWDLEDLGDGDA